jgi:hypothetical protein
MFTNFMLSITIFCCRSYEMNIIIDLADNEHSICTEVVTAPRQEK